MSYSVAWVAHGITAHITAQVVSRYYILHRVPRRRVTIQTTFDCIHETNENITDTISRSEVGDSLTLNIW